MAKTAYKLNTKETINFLPTNARKPFSKIVDGLDDNFFFADALWSKSPGKALVVKLSKANLDKARTRIVNAPKQGEKVNFEIGGYKFSFLQSAKRKGMSDAETTRKQELASLWIIKSALGPSPRKVWKNVDELRKASSKDANELFLIYPELIDNTKWLDGLLAQQNTMLDELKVGRYDEWNRDGGFMEYISKLVKDEFGISKKDSWNPADIWVARDEPKIREELEKVVKDSATTIQELNEAMINMWNSKKLKGISLKAVSGNTAEFEEVNIDSALFKKIDTTVYVLDKIICDLFLKNGKFASQDMKVFIKEEGQQAWAKFQVTQNSKGFNNLKVEGTALKAGAARLGKVPLDLLKLMMTNDYKNYGTNFSAGQFTNKWQDYPKTIETFNNNYDTFLNIWKEVKSEVETGITNEDEFAAGFQNAWGEQEDVASSKLMQLTFAHALLKMKKENRRRLITDMAFLSQKKGRRFGPFGKLY